MIPKNINFVWIDKNNSKSRKIPDKNNMYLNTWKVNNPDFNIKIWFNDDIYKLLNEVDPKYLSFYDNIKTTICKCDFIRMIIVYFVGGIYSDLDFFCLRSLNGLIQNKPYLFFQEVPEHHFDGIKRLCNGFFASAKNNPFILGWIEYIMSNWEEPKNADDIMAMTGPVGFQKYYETNPIVVLDNPCFVMPLSDQNKISKICKDETPYTLTVWKDGSGWTAENFVFNEKYNKKDNTKSNNWYNNRMLFFILFFVVLIIILIFLKVNIKIIFFILFFLFLLSIITIKSP